MFFALSTNWNSLRHTRGEALVDEALALGFEALEMGYHMTAELAAGIRHCTSEGRIRVSSVHAFSPVPVGAPFGYPELYLLASLDEDERAMATMFLHKTLDFAQEMGAQAVVLHAGRIKMRSLFNRISTESLLAVLEGVDEDREAPAMREALKKAEKRRARYARKIFDTFCLTLEHLLPRFEAAKVALCLENLPSLEAFPDEREMLMLKQRLPTPALAHWHDLGHGATRGYLGLIDHVRSAREMLPITRGIHIQDTVPPEDAHLAPGEGQIDFSAFAFYNTEDVLKVFEPGRHVEAARLQRGLAYLRELWQAAPGVHAESVHR